MVNGRRTAWLALGIGAVLAACGGSGGGGPGGGGGPPLTLPIVDVAVRGSSPAGPRIHVYRDILHGAVSGHAPDLSISPPANIAFMAFTGTELVLGADFGMASQNRIWVYTQADLANAVITPSVQCLLPPPAGAATVGMKDLVVHGGDLYVYSTYSTSPAPFTLNWVTHVFRDVATLPNATPPDATITHDTLTTSSLIVSHDNLAVADDVLLATGNGQVFRNLAPGSLSGAVAPDASILLGDLDLTICKVALGGGEAYFHNSFSIRAFPNAAGLTAGQTPRFMLEGPSTVLPRQGAILRLGNRLFSRGPFNVSPISIVGFDVAGLVPDFLPPDVMLGPPTVGDHHLHGAADTLVAASPTTGVVAVYPNASFLVDGSQPSFFLYDPDVITAAEVRAVQR